MPERSAAATSCSRPRRRRPFVEGKEVVSGYTEIEVADLDEALRMVKTWPGCPIVEVRPLE